MTEQLFPSPVVGALIFDKDGKMLMCSGPKWGSHFITPGGHVEVGETLEKALKREIMEEINLEIEDIEFLVFHEAIFSKEFLKKKHFLFFDCVCRAKNPKKMKLDNIELTEAVWIEPKKALEELDLEHYTRKSIEKYLNRKD